MLDFYSGWNRPCDGGGLTLRKYNVMNWGMVPYDYADYFTENVFETLFPNYRAFAMDDERGEVATRPFVCLYVCISVYLSICTPHPFHQRTRTRTRASTHTHTTVDV